MEIQKTTWRNGDHKVSLAFPIAKVDKENRTVSGFATLDNVDRHGDIVLSDASKRAFERFRGNIREMHQPIAVGKILSFNEEDFYDAESGSNFKGVYVNAYISKGAQDTWEKVLDGTLTGFSIGGDIVEASMEKGESDAEEERRVIKEYDLHELSLVDSPANPLANIFSIQKNGDSLIFKGMSTEIETENVFWCKSDQIATSATGDARSCSICGESMETIGWVEKFDNEKSQAIKKIVDGLFKKDDAPTSSHGPNGTTDSPSAPLNVIDSEETINLYPDQNSIGTTKGKKKKKKINKGGNIVENENLEELESNQAEEIEEVVEDGDDTAIEKAVDISEVEVDELDFTKMVTDLKDFVGEKLEKNFVKASEESTEIRKALDSRFEEIEAEKEELKKSIDGLKEIVEGLQKSLTETTKKVEAVENDTAVKKSGEVDKPETSIKKTSIWQGHFLGVQDL